MFAVLPTRPSCRAAVPSLEWPLSDPSLNFEVLRCGGGSRFTRASTDKVVAHRDMRRSLRLQPSWGEGMLLAGRNAS